MNNCRVEFIERDYMSTSPELVNRLTNIYNDAWKAVTSSKLFREWKGDDGKTYYLYSNPGTDQNRKQNELIDEVNELYNVPQGKRLISSAPTKSGFNQKVVIDIRSVAQQEWDLIQARQSVKERETDLGINEEGDSVFFQSNPNAINAGLKVVNILQSQKADEIFRKGDKNNWSLEKILNELQVPQNQQDILKQYNTRNREQLITSLLADYSYVIEIKTTTKDTITPKMRAEAEATGINLYEFGAVDQEEGVISTDYYSNLTVPGGTNYTENEIATPTIAPSIKGHAQFSTDNGLMWSRTDERIQYQENEIDKLLKIMENNGVLKIKCS